MGSDWSAVAVGMARLGGPACGGAVATGIACARSELWQGPNQPNQPRGSRGGSNELRVAGGADFAVRGEEWSEVESPGPKARRNDLVAMAALGQAHSPATVRGAALVSIRWARARW